jgi:hypothetical protein
MHNLIYKYKFTIQLDSIQYKKIKKKDCFCLPVIYGQGISLYSYTPDVI